MWLCIRCSLLIACDVTKEYPLNWGLLPSNVHLDLLGKQIPSVITFQGFTPVEYGYCTLNKILPCSGFGPRSCSDWIYGVTEPELTNHNVPVYRSCVSEWVPDACAPGSDRLRPEWQLNCGTLALAHVQSASSQLSVCHASLVHGCSQSTGST